MTSQANRLAHRVSAILFGAVFVFSGAVKAMDPQRFLMAIRGFRLVPDPFAAWLALGLPWLEIFCGLAVISGFLRDGALLLLNLCLLVFLAAIAIAWSRGLDIECGCFGSAIKTSMKTEFVLDLVMVAIGLWLMRRRNSFP